MSRKIIFYIMNESLWLSATPFIFPCSHFIVSKNFLASLIFCSLTFHFRSLLLSLLLPACRHHHDQYNPTFLKPYVFYKLWYFSKWKMIHLKTINRFSSLKTTCEIVNYKLSFKQEILLMIHGRLYLFIFSEGILEIK